MLILAGLVLFGLAGTAQDAQRVAERFLALVKVSDATGLSQLFHYPPDMSETERQKDSEGVSSSLAWLLSTFGTPSSIKPISTTVEFYELGVFGGSNAYWERRAPVSTTQFTYDVTFSKLGPGYFKVSVLSSGAGAGRELHAASFGIPASAPNAKDTAIDLMIELMRFTGLSTPPDLREVLQERLKPSRTSPIDPH